MGLLAFLASLALLPSAPAQAQNSADTTPPTVSNFIPADGASAVPTNRNLVLTFSEPVRRGILTISEPTLSPPFFRIRKVSGSIVIRPASGADITIPVTDSRVSVSGRRVTIDPAADLAASTEYLVLIDAGAFEDLAGNDYAGAGEDAVGNATWNFTTAAGADTKAPGVTSYTPSGSGVSVDASLLEFGLSEPVRKGSGNIVIRPASGSDIVIPVTDSQVSVSDSGRHVTIDPTANLAIGTAYHVRIDAGAFEDLAGNDFAGISDATYWYFTTAETVAPIVRVFGGAKRFSPQDGATGVPTHRNLYIHFNKPVRKGSGNIVIRPTSGSDVTIPVTDSQVRIWQDAVYIDPTANLAGSTAYHVRIAAGAFEDLSGNDYAGIADDTTWNFTTADTTAPSLSTATVSGTTLVLTYDEALDTDSAPAPNAYRVTVSGGSGAVGAGSGAAPSSVSISGSAVTLTLGTAVTHGQTVTVSYTKPGTNPVRDSAGNEAENLADQAVTSTTGKPGQPTGVTASAGDGQVTLGWTAVEGTTGWQVRQRTFGAWGAWTDIEGSGSATAGHVAAGLANGTLYGFQVRARNASGYGAASNEKTARPVSATGTAPAAPAALTATAGDAEAALGWTHTSDRTVRSWEYRLGEGTGSDWGAWTVMTMRAPNGETGPLGALARRYLVGDLTNGTAYRFEVRAVNARGPGAVSGQASATPAVPSGGPAKPTGVSATAGNTQVTLGWEAIAGATRWEYQRKAGTAGWGRWTTGVFTNAGTATGFTDTGLANGVQYTYRVRAADANGPGVASDPVSATPARSTAKPARVADLTAQSRGETSVRLEWSAEASHHDTVAQWQYRLKTTGAYGEWTGMERSNAQDFTGWTVEGLTAGTAYTFQVRGSNVAREGDASNEATATTESAPAGPDAVASVNVVHNGTSLTVSWDAPARATHYDVTYTGGGGTGRAAWNRAGESVTITCDIRPDHQGQNCIDGGTAYTVGVRARNAAGESAWTNSAAAPGPQTAPDAVAEVRVTHKGGKLSVSWDAPARATHYDVTYYRHDNGANARAAWNRAGTSLEIVCDSRYPGQNRDCVTSGATYTVGVRARNAAGESGWTNSAATAGPALGVADATVAEGASASLAFAVTLAPASSERVTVDYATSDGTAAAGSDYTATSGTLTFAAGETSKTVNVSVLDDAHDETSETLTLTLSNASGATISDAAATGTITNADSLQKDWLARFGRAAASDAIAAVTARLETPRDAGSHFTVGGQRLPFGDAGAGLPPEPADGPGGPSWLSWSDDPNRDVSRTMSERDLLMGTSFRMAFGTDTGSQWTGWGQGASVSAFSGGGPGLSLSGETATGSMGMDYEHGRLLTGFAMTHSLGEGTAQGAGRSYVMGSSVTTVLPYARYALSERVSAWGLAGTGTGRLTLDLDDGAPERYRADLAMTLAAMGVRGELVTPDEAGGFALALKADGFWVRTESESVSAPGVGNLAGARADASRLRAVLDGSRTFALSGGGTLTPSVELGVRHDGGDAETGTGMEVGAGVGYADPSRGLDMVLKVHGLAAHAEGGYNEWSVSGQLRLVPGGAGRGLTASLTPSYGADPGGSERLWTLPDANALAANGDAPPSSRLDGELGYGMAVFGGGFTGTPNVGFGLSDTAREYRMGWRLAPAGGGGFEFNLDAARREAVNDNGGSGAGSPEHRVGFGVTARW